MRELDEIQPDGARVVFGAGTERRVAALLAEAGAQRALLVCLPHHRAGADRVAAALGGACAGVFAEAEAHVPERVAEAARQRARSVAADWVVAHGGGSAVGVAKAVALTEDVAVGAVPTTYAGSERTSIWGITSAGGKATGRDPRVLPRLVVYDPELTAGLPRELSLLSLLNALAHVVEALYAQERTEAALAAAREAVEPLLDGLRRLGADPSDGEGRAEALFGAMLAGSALGGASMALHHKLAHVLGGSFGTPHAHTHAVLLPHTMAFNLPASTEARAVLSQGLGDDPPAGLYDLMRALQLPTGLASLAGAVSGPTREALPTVARTALHKQYANPRPVTEEGLLALLRDLWHDRRPSLRTRRVALASSEPLSVRGARLAQARAAVLAVHGRGASADRLLADLQRRVREVPSVAWAAPQGLDRQWYPKGFAEPVSDNQPWLDASLRTLDEAWAAVTAHLPPERVVLTGFSQGACLLVTWLGARQVRPAAVVVLTGAALPMELDYTALNGVRVYLGSAESDRWVPAQAVQQTAQALRATGAQVTVHLEPTDRHAIHEADDVALRRAVETAMTDDDLDYQTGFGNALRSEARPGALPLQQNAPRAVPYGLFTEQLNGTGFTVQRALNRRTWLYRLRSTITPATWSRLDAGRFVGRFDEGSSSPQVRRYAPAPRPQASTDFLGGLTTFAGAGDPVLRRGAAVHLYAADRDMERVFANIDGDLILVPFDGPLRLQTELGWLHVPVGHVAVVPRALRFRVLLPDGASRGWVGEVYDGHLVLPERGPVGANGLADERHFRAPVAAYVDEGQTQIVHKHGGQLWAATVPHSPFDVVAWHGTYAPFVYDLMRFNSLGSVSFDHPDPSILTVLTCPADDHGRNAMDFAVFRGRWDASEHTFRPPFFHRNSAVEFNGVVRSSATTGPWVAGAFSFTPYLSPHGVSAQGYRQAISGPEELADRPVRLSDDSLWIQFESMYLMRLMPWFVDAEHEDGEYLASFDGYPSGELTG
ncbi:MAG: homogentisate 1,2-dioxygenase [Myxococcales bacterium]|nr:homogentisate 1,2-dioxygenase [Myxococcales bacterium]